VASTAPQGAHGTRSLILREATRLFAARGYRGVSLGDIGAAVGISGPAIYRHFTGKEALLGEILVGISETLLDGGRRRRGQASDPPAARKSLDALVAFHVEFALTHPELIAVQDRDFHNLTPDDQRRVRRLQREYVEIWVDELRRARPQLPGDQARAAVHAVFGLLNSTPYSMARRPASAPAADLLRTMALAALDSPA
jgi:AcrR family transcriptional regulator